jgi:23S rRNA pseudouridine2605 synthase
LSAAGLASTHPPRLHVARIEVLRPSPARFRESGAIGAAGATPCAGRARSTAQNPSGPQKIHKVLAQAGLGSRREMEELIRAGKVKVNGALAQVGMRVQAGDVIRVGRRQVTVRDDSKLQRIILYHKPEGEIVSHDDPQGRPSVFDKLPPMRRGKWLAIGRLDYNTSGLLIFTTSGELANRLMHPRYEVEREYAVRVIGKLTEEKIRQLTRGVRLEDGMARFEVLEERGGRGLNNWYRVVLREGRNRIVRRMFDAVGYKVSRLMRVRFGIVSLPFGLRRGGWREPDTDGGDFELVRDAGRARPPQACAHRQISWSRSSRKTRSPPALVDSQVGSSRGNAASNAARPLPTSTSKMPPGSRCRCAWSRMRRTASMPSAPPASASAGSCRYSGGKCRIASAST